MKILKKEIQNLKNALEACKQSPKTGSNAGIPSENGQEAKEGEEGKESSLIAIENLKSELEQCRHEICVKNEEIEKQHSAILELREQKEQTTLLLEELESEKKYLSKKIESMNQERRVPSQQGAGIPQESLLEKSEASVEKKLTEKIEEMKRENDRLKSQIQSLEVKILDKKKSTRFGGFFNKTTKNFDYSQLQALVNTSVVVMGLMKGN